MRAGKADQHPPAVRGLVPGFEAIVVADIEHLRVVDWECTITPGPAQPSSLPRVLAKPQVLLAVKAGLENAIGRGKYAAQTAEISAAEFRGRYALPLPVPDCMPGTPPTQGRAQPPLGEWQVRSIGALHTRGRITIVR